MEQPTDLSGFYDRLAPEYDLMTGFEKRIATEASLFKKLVDRYAIHSALDAGSGTGYHSVVLAQLGVNVTALDISREALEEGIRTLGEAMDEVLAGDRAPKAPSSRRET